MTREELKAAYQFGQEVIRNYKANGEDVPACIYERVIELADMLIKVQEG